MEVVIEIDRLLTDGVEIHPNSPIHEKLNQALRQPAVISCVCPNEIKTGTVSIHCCNLCGKPDEDWWGKH